MWHVRGTILYRHCQCSGQAGCAVRRAAPRDGALAAGEEAGLELLGRAGMVAVRVADLACPAGAGTGRDGRTALTAAGAGKIRAGELVVWLKPVAVTRAVVALPVDPTRISCSGPTRPDRFKLDQGFRDRSYANGPARR